MAKQKGLGIERSAPAPKGTSIGCGKVKLSSMNKRKKVSYKKYRGQGR